MSDPALTAALGADNVTLFGAIQIDLPGYTLRLIDGAGVVMIGGEMFSGADPAFGVLESIDSIQESIGEQAPEISISLFPKSDIARGSLVSPSMQDSLFTLMVGAVDPVTGVAIGTPEVKFAGEIDVPTMSLSLGQRSIEYTVVSVFERLFDGEEGVRASDGYHQSIWPGERGLEYMTGTDRNLYWGSKKPLPSGGSGYGGGGGRGGVNFDVDHR